MDYQLGKLPTWKKGTYPNIKDSLEERDLMKEIGVNLKNFLFNLIKEDMVLMKLELDVV